MNRFRDMADIIGPIFAVDWEVHVFNALVAGEPLIHDSKTGLKKLEASVYRALLKHFDAWNCLGMYMMSVHDGQTDGQTRP